MNPTNQLDAPKLEKIVLSYLLIFPEVEGGVVGCVGVPGGEGGWGTIAWLVVGMLAHTSLFHGQ